MCTWRHGGLQSYYVQDHTSSHGGPRTHRSVWPFIWQARPPPSCPLRSKLPSLTWFIATTSWMTCLLHLHLHSPYIKRVDLSNVIPIHFSTQNPAMSSHFTQNKFPSHHSQPENSYTHFFILSFLTYSKAMVLKVWSLIHFQESNDQN